MRERDEKNQKKKYINTFKAFWNYDKTAFKAHTVALILSETVMTVWCSVSIKQTFEEQCQASELGERRLRVVMFMMIFVHLYDLTRMVWIIWNILLRVSERQEQATLGKVVVVDCFYFNALIVYILAVSFGLHYRADCKRDMPILYGWLWIETVYFILKSTYTLVVNVAVIVWMVKRKRRWNLWKAEYEERMGVYKASKILFGNMRGNQKKDDDKQLRLQKSKTLTHVQTVQHLKPVPAFRNRF